MEATTRKPSAPIHTKFCRELIEVLKDASPMPEVAVLYDESTHILGKLESVLIPRGTHHVIRQATKPNVLCVLCYPAFNINDETESPELR